MTPAALGFRVHSGWAALVALSGTFPSPTILERRLIEMADPRLLGSKQPFHAAENLKLPDAEKLIARCAESSKQLAGQNVSSVLHDLSARGYQVVACGLPVGSGRPLTTLAATLASHTLIHTAEGEFFRDIIAECCAHAGLTVLRIKEKELLSRTAADFALSSTAVQAALSALGRVLGPPWRQEEKYACLAASLALTSAGAPG